MASIWAAFNQADGTVFYFQNQQFMKLGYYGLIHLLIKDVVVRNSIYYIIIVIIVIISRTHAHARAHVFRQQVLAQGGPRCVSFWYDVIKAVPTWAKVCGPSLELFDF